MRVHKCARLKYGHGIAVPKRLPRDIILFAAADEEKGSTYGTQWMLAYHWPELAAEYAWDEGSFGLQDFFGPTPVFTIAVTEKRDLWLKLIAHGEPGHSGMPHSANAAEILLRALARVKQLETHYKLHPVVQTMFAQISTVVPQPQALLLSHLDHPICFRLAQKALTANPTIVAMLKDTLSITVLRAGDKENVITRRSCQPAAPLAERQSVDRQDPHRTGPTHRA
ncbi:MAG: hypothetical protein EOM24_10100 [Chloroflexia bacterium]|nr:hypothetical protein [Chloroflexia bacterium]